MAHAADFAGFVGQECQAALAAGSEGRQRPTSPRLPAHHIYPATGEASPCPDCHRIAFAWPRVSRLLWDDMLDMLAGSWLLAPEQSLQMMSDAWLTMRASPCGRLSLEPDYRLVM